MGKNKYYAVRKGKTPGVYEDWDSCQAVTKGFPGAEFKSFNTRGEALAYLGGAGTRTAAAAPRQQQPGAAGTNQSAHAAGTSGGAKWFAIQQGHRTGVFSGNWNSIKPLVEGCSGARYKSFSTRDAAEQWLRTAGGAQAAAGGSGASLSGTKRTYSAIAEQQQPPPAFTAGNASSTAAAAAGTGAGAGAAGPQQQQQQQQQQQGELMVTVHFDGGSRGNPGRAGYGYAITDRRTGQQLRLGCKPLPYGSTNNEAEYSGMIAGMRYASEVLGARHVVVKGDSQLAVKQMKGEYRVNAENIAPLFREAKQLQDNFASFEIQHVYREDNSLADALSNIAMDTDLVMDQIAAGRAGSTRRLMALALARACQLEQHLEQWQHLCSADSFLQASAELLSRMWDHTPVEEVLAQLNSRGWDEHTGGPPEPPPPPPAAAAGGAAAAGSDANSSMPGAGTTAAAAGGGPQGGGRRGVSGRGQQAVAVAAVRLGPQWAAEISRQEQLIHQQQQQQQGAHRSGAGGGGGGRGRGAAVAGAGLGFDALGGSTGPAGPGGSLRGSSSRGLTGHTASSCGAVEAACGLSAAPHSRGVRAAGRVLARRAMSNCAAAVVDVYDGVQQCAGVSAHRPPCRPPVLQATLHNNGAGVGSFACGQHSVRALQPSGRVARALPRGGSSSMDKGRAWLPEAPLQYCRCCSAGDREQCSLHAAAARVCRVWHRVPGRSMVRAAPAAAGVAAMAAAIAGRLRPEQQGQGASSRRAQGLRRF